MRTAPAVKLCSLLSLLRSPFRRFCVTIPTASDKLGEAARNHRNAGKQQSPHHSTDDYAQCPPASVVSHICQRTRPPECNGLELLRDLNEIMLGGSSQFVCDQIEGADGEQSEPSKNHYLGTLAEWRDIVLLLPTHNHCPFIDRHHHTSGNQVTSSEPVDKLAVIAAWIGLILQSRRPLTTAEQFNARSIRRLIARRIDRNSLCNKTECPPSTDATCFVPALPWPFPLQSCRYLADASNPKMRHPATRFLALANPTMIPSNQNQLTKGK